MRTKPLGWAMVLVSIGAVSVVGCSAKASPKAGGVQTAPASGGPDLMVVNCQTAEYEPAVLTLSCADANLRLEHMAWSKWDTSGASGVGLVTRNTCKPDCASGEFVTSDVTATLSKPVAYLNHEVFSSVTFTPAHSKAETYDIITKPLA